MQNILIGCGQITWKNVPEETILAEIAEAGYAGAPIGLKPEGDTPELLESFGQHNLKPAPGYLSGEFWDPAQTEILLDRAHQYACLMHEAGCSELYVAASGSNWVARSGKTRREVAGHVSADDSLSNIQFKQFAETLNRIGEITLESGVRSCFHNHVGTVIETRSEIDRLFALVDPDIVFLGPDTGHLAWGGVDVVDFCSAYADRILTMHVKDIDPKVLVEGRQAKWDYRTFSDRGIFTELGRGFVNFPAILDILTKADFSGWLIVETDVTQQPSALESAKISRQYLADLGY